MRKQKSVHQSLFIFAEFEELTKNEIDILTTVAKGLKDRRLND